MWEVMVVRHGTWYWGFMVAQKFLNPTPDSKLIVQWHMPGPVIVLSRFASSLRVPWLFG